MQRKTQCLPTASGTVRLCWSRAELAAASKPMETRFAQQSCPCGRSPVAKHLVVSGKVILTQQKAGQISMWPQPPRPCFSELHIKPPASPVAAARALESCSRSQGATCNWDSALHAFPARSRCRSYGVRWLLAPCLSLSPLSWRQRCWEPAAAGEASRHSSCCPGP